MSADLHVIRPGTSVAHVLLPDVQAIVLRVEISFSRAVRYEIAYFWEGIRRTEWVYEVETLTRLPADFKIGFKS